MSTTNTGLVEIYKSPQTVFNIPGLALIWKATDPKLIKSRINYYVKTGKILSPRNGIYAKDNFDPLELATKIYTPSYVSLDTVLRKAGVIFQYSTQITVISYISRHLVIGDLQIAYRKIKPDILLNLTEIKNVGNYYLASPERAFLDSLYLQGPIHFDNLGPLNWDTCRKLANIYKNKNLLKLVDTYARHHKT